MREDELTFSASIETSQYQAGFCFGKESDTNVEEESHEVLSNIQEKSWCRGGILRLPSKVAVVVASPHLPVMLHAGHFSSMLQLDLQFRSSVVIVRSSWIPALQGRQGHLALSELFCDPSEIECEPLALKKKPHSFLNASFTAISLPSRLLLHLQSKAHSCFGIVVHHRWSTSFSMKYLDLPGDK